MWQYIHLSFLIWCYLISVAKRTIFCLALSLSLSLSVSVSTYRRTHSHIYSICLLFLYKVDKVALARVFSPITSVFRAQHNFTNARCVSYRYRIIIRTESIFNHLKASGFFTYHQVKYSKILHGSRFALSVLYGSQKRELPLLTSLTLILLTWRKWWAPNNATK
jgi:hypothetical protein